MDQKAGIKRADETDFAEGDTRSARVMRGLFLRLWLGLEAVGGSDEVK